MPDQQLSQLLQLEKNGKILIGVNRASATTIMASKSKIVGFMALLTPIVMIAAIVIGIKNGFLFGCGTLMTLILVAPLTQSIASAKLRQKAYEDIGFFEYCYNMGWIVIRNAETNERIAFPSSWRDALSWETSARF